ncbi:hypothetical protein C7U92_04010 [Bradyrhizobium sp. WBOS7]|uniref:Uncharacterized protein n=1 Tax=Bradyrhizobium betae TaxID=244734 RepID=A0AAE9NB81_9BRAD|nr:MULTISPECIES: hypothetical protein [Bradyrhizobium]MDD1569803.1 hypothetical protein [Bradyrhizobium sp. WBOS1]UUO35725.1 hypothetical protein DCK84_14910 [Bradyrhizobium sp. WBOS01]MDD1526492.1 hypothetical protein [Bradyrhizobium sp. WBOS2]MDD1575902.1 hypothetical protein [Bradyrhizobium sp. WBOS7]MDD1599509.1 hypothetical protein [Bradyrhizobium sp. WBOS16]
MSEQLHPMAPHHLPFYIIAPGQTDVLMIVTGIILIGAVFGVGLLYWHLHSLPERMAHKTQKLQFEIVAVLGLLALFTHEHLYWIAALVLALIELPDFGTPLRSIAGSVERIADSTSQVGASEAPQPDTAAAPATVSQEDQIVDTEQKVRSHA